MAELAIIGLLVLCIGLLADIVGFILVFFRGHMVFIRRVASETSLDANAKHDYTLRYWTESETTTEDLRREAKARRPAYLGAVLVILGFGLQIAGAVMLFVASA